MNTYACNIKRIINKYFLDNYELNTVLNIDYRTDSGRGHFTINNMQDFFPVPAGKMKIIIDIIKKADAPQEPAGVLYDYLRRCAEHLTILRDKTDGITDQEKRTRAELTNAIKKYNANIEALTKYFDFEKVADNNAVKMEKCEVVTLKYDPVYHNYNAVNYTGKRFTKGGHIFHVYKVNRLTYIIIPCCGLACVQYDGAINTAPEYITPELLEKINNWDFTEANKRFIDALKTAENIIINDDIITPAPAEAETPAPVVDDAPAPAPAETIQPAPAEELKSEKAPAPAEENPKHAAPRKAVNRPAQPVYIAMVYYGLIPPAGIHPERRKTAKKARYNELCINNHMRPKTPVKTAHNAQLYPAPLRLYAASVTPYKAPPGYTAAGYYIQTPPRPVAALYRPNKPFYNTS